MTTKNTTAKAKDKAPDQIDLSLNDLLLRGRVSAPATVKELPSGDKVVELKPQAAAEAKAQAGNTRQRSQDRQATAPDVSGEGRNAKGDGRQVD